MPRKRDSIPVGIYKLFFGRRFEAHRLGGLIFILQYCAAVLHFTFNPKSFMDSWLVFSVPLGGVLQAVTASIYFTFLPKKIDPAFMGDRHAISYAFVVENIFFALLLMFQWWFYSDWIMPYVPLPVQIAFIFFPYVWRPLFPKTSFRESLYNANNKSAKHRLFFTNSTHFVKTFYIFSKHFIGYFLNYIRFLDRVSDDERISVYFILVVAQFSTTVAMFLHTLAFRGYITKKRSMELYLASLIILIYGWTAMYGMISRNLDLAFIALLGCAINFKNRYYQHTYQLLVFMLIMYAKYYLFLDDENTTGNKNITGDSSLATAFFANGNSAKNHSLDSNDCNQNLSFCP